MDIFVISIKCTKNIDEKVLNSFQNSKQCDILKKNQHCLSYLMTDRILREFYQIKNREIEFINNKPFLKSREKYISISHSHGYVALAFSDFDCGVDIEKIKPRNIEKISKRLGFKNKNIEEFYKNWTLYESEYKLGKAPLTTKMFQFDDYIINACSSNIEETFELYIQISKDFSKVKG